MTNPLLLSLVKRKPKARGSGKKAGEPWRKRIDKLRDNALLIHARRHFGGTHPTSICISRAQLSDFCLKMSYHQGVFVPPLVSFVSSAGSGTLAHSRLVTSERIEPIRAHQSSSEALRTYPKPSEPSRNPLGTHQQQIKNLSGIHQTRQRSVGSDPSGTHQGPIRPIRIHQDPRNRSETRQKPIRNPSGTHQTQQESIKDSPGTHQGPIRPIRNS